MAHIEVIQGDITKLTVAAESVRKTLNETCGIQRVIFVCFDEENFLYTNQAWKDNYRGPSELAVC